MILCFEMTCGNGIQWSVLNFLNFSRNKHEGPIHLQADSAFEASSTGLRPVNWPDFFPGKNRPINWPEADWEASSEADCLRPIRRPVQEPIHDRPVQKPIH